MKQKFTRIKTGIMALALIGCAAITRGQAVLYEEDFGTPTANTLIQYYTGWQDSTVTYVGNGTCDVRSSSASSGYGGASGGGNVMLNDTVKWFQISGLNTSSAQTTAKLYCGLRKTTSENGNNFAVEFSTDSIVWVRVPMSDTLPTGTGTSGWYRVCFPNLPAHLHLHIRFASLANVDYRLDDIRICDGDEVVLETVATPTCSPAGGTYYEPQQVTLECATSGATIHYTLDGSTPDNLSPVCAGILHIGSNCTLKAFAMKENMYNSEVMTAQFTIIDTNAVVALPFDISHNSESERIEVKTIPGFQGYKLGSSYADGSAKFESKNAGSASLTAHLGDAPGELTFDLKGVKGGTPSAYNGITFLISESANGLQWTTVTTLNEMEISTEGYSHHGPYTLSENTRYVRWMLVTAGRGNTQFNNIAITQRQSTGDGSDSTGVVSFANTTEGPYPNPAHHSFRWDPCKDAHSIQLYDLNGNIVRFWRDVTDGYAFDISGLAAGTYLLRAETPHGHIAKKLVVR